MNIEIMELIFWFYCMYDQWHYIFNCIYLTVLFVRSNPNLQNPYDFYLWQTYPDSRLYLPIFISILNSDLNIKSRTHYKCNILCLKKRYVKDFTQNDCVAPERTATLLFTYKNMWILVLFFFWFFLHFCNN